MQDTVGEVEMNSYVMYSSRPPHMDEQRQDVWLGPTCYSSVLIQDVAMKTYRKRWTMERGGGRGSGRTVLMVRHNDDDVDDDDDDCFYMQFSCFKKFYLTLVVLFIKYSFEIQMISNY